MEYSINEVAKLPDDLFQDPHTRPLAIALSHLSPDELSLWWDEVRPLRAIWISECKKYEDLLTSRKIAEGVIISHTTREAENVLVKWIKAFAIDTLRLKKTSKGIDFKQFMTKKGGLQVVAAGLSFMQILAISELLGVQIDNLEPSDIPLAVVSIIAALSLTFGSKEALVFWVKAKRYDGVSQPFWKRLTSGDSLFLCSLTLIVLEMAFAAPGLISLLPPRQASQFLPQVTAYCASGLGAFVNIMLSYGIAYDEIAFEKKFSLKVEVEPDPREQIIDTFNIDLETARLIRANYDKEARFQERIVHQAEKRYMRALERWRKQVKRIVRSREFRRGEFGKGSV
ncbi:MAG: hypothetical protein KME15_16475 [Drouetiella hepatica Uher 2000/2452]|jgi:hypothetical protein|uniref:Uncharacterized protein n=1 Tax=Drouetiella hepatica Uher 2000/2452 TaxID=904376 RepID=A0A951QCG7_9CYAN|nr:hypothetical protein [Drouetiella hepatica Uher 2000/2452]